MPTAYHGDTHASCVADASVASTTVVPKRHTPRTSVEKLEPDTVTVVRPPASLIAGSTDEIAGTAARAGTA